MTRRSLLFASLAALERNPVQWIDKNLESGEESTHWDSPTVPVSMGSLLKPFLALAYSVTHGDYPAIYCTGSSSGCWYARGHGEEHFVEALADSCNSYFLALAGRIDRAALDTICLTYGLEAPARSLPAADLIGLGHGWPQSPLNVARAFATLASNAGETSVRTVLAGMARSAKAGTARAVGVCCYAKTGTAPCSHLPRAAGDGFAVAIYPPDQPRGLVLLQHHNTTGANAARDVRPLVAATV